MGISAGRSQIGQCNRCGFKYPRSALRTDGRQTQLLVCTACWEPDHPLDYPPPHRPEGIPTWDQAPQNLAGYITAPVASLLGATMSWTEASINSDLTDYYRVEKLVAGVWVAQDTIYVEYTMFAGIANTNHLSYAISGSSLGDQFRVTAVSKDGTHRISSNTVTVQFPSLSPAIDGVVTGPGELDWTGTQVVPRIAWFGGFPSSNKTSDAPTFLLGPTMTTFSESVAPSAIRVGKYTYGRPIVGTVGSIYIWYHNGSTLIKSTISCSRSGGSGDYPYRYVNAMMIVGSDMRMYFTDVVPNGAVYDITVGFKSVTLAAIDAIGNGGSLSITSDVSYPLTTSLTTTIPRNGAYSGGNTIFCITTDPYTKLGLRIYLRMYTQPNAPLYAIYIGDGTVAQSISFVANTALKTDIPLTYGSTVIDPASGPWAGNIVDLGASYSRALKFMEVDVIGIGRTRLVVPIQADISGSESGVATSQCQSKIQYSPGLVMGWYQPDGASEWAEVVVPTIIGQDGFPVHNVGFPVLSEGGISIAYTPDAVTDPQQDHNILHTRDAIHWKNQIVNTNNNSTENPNYCVILPDYP
jgi:hypothetical protein